MLQRPLGKFERAPLISDRYAALNVVTGLQLESPPPPAEIAAALAEVQRQQPALRVRLESISDRPHFVELDNPPLPFNTSVRQDEDQWLWLAESELGKRIDIDPGPLFRCTYLYAPTRAELVLTFQHTIVDASSIAVMLHELLSRCAGGPPTPGNPQELTPAVDTRFPTAFRGPRLALHAAGYMLGQLRDELSYHLLARGLPEAAVHRGALPRLLTMEIDPELTAKLVRRARKQQVTLNSLLNAAMLLAVQRRRYGGRARPMRTFSFPDLRASVSPQIPAGSLAAYFSMLRYTLRLGGEASLWETAGALHSQIYASLKRGDKYAANVLSAGMMRMMVGLRSMRMAHAALSYTGASQLQARYGDIRVCGLHGFISGIDLGPEFSAQVSLFAGRLVWDIVYMDSDMDRSAASEIAEEIQAILRAGVEA